MEFDDARALAARLWDDVWRDRKFDVVDEIFTDPVVRHSPDGNSVVSRGDYKSRLQDAQRTLARSATTIDDFAVSGDRMWTRATSRGVNLETGEAAVVSWLVVQRVEDGRIAEFWITAHRDVDWQS